MHDHADHEQHDHGPNHGHSHEPSAVRKRPSNPFMHDHAHHHHDDDEDMLDALDPAQQSLSDALRVSFGVLKTVMVLLIVVYLGSGVFQVEEQERAVRLRFGKIVGDPGQQVYAPGWHVGLPYPIEEIVRVPTATRTVNIDKAYWYEVSQTDAGKTTDELAQRSGPLNPERDGSLLTGDANIVHGRFRVGYRVDDPVDYASNVGNAQRADELVTATAEQAVVRAVAELPADAFIQGQSNTDKAQRTLQKMLDGMRTGIRVDYVVLDARTMPLQVRSAYQAVINAESEKGQLINQARQERAQILGAAAGEAVSPGQGNEGPLLTLIRAFQIARAANDQARADELESQLNQALAALRITDEQTGQPVRIGGEAARKINEAKAYRTQVRQQVLAEVDNFTRLYEQYRKNPRIVMNRLWQDAREKVLTGDIETIYAPPGQPYIVINRDPQLQRQREVQRLQQAQEDARNTAGGN